MINIKGKEIYLSELAFKASVKTNYNIYIAFIFYLGQFNNIGVRKEYWNESVIEHTKSKIEEYPEIKEDIKKF